MQLRDYVKDAGAGFCREALPDLLPPDLADSPLLIGLDTNLVADIVDHGPLILDDDDAADIPDREYQEQLIAFGNIINVWLMRDIRFVVLPKGYTDYKRFPKTPEGRAKLAQRIARLNQIHDALAFQMQNWSDDDIRVLSAEECVDVDASLQDDLQELPKGADRVLVHESIVNGLDVFLTRDKGILRSASRFRKYGLSVLTPVQLWQKINDCPQPAFLFAGKADHADCLYGYNILMGDSGKWSYLMAAFNV